MLLASLAGFAALSATAIKPMEPTTIYDFTAKDIEGKTAKISDYKGKVVLVVNVASQCGNTPQYATLQKFYTEHKKEGLVVLGFPCNQFGGQEPGTEKDIKQFCTENYHVTFPMFSKVDVNGEHRAPIYSWLIAKTDGKDIDWNFAKFIVGRDGKSVKRFPARMKPDSDEFSTALRSALDSK